MIKRQWELTPEKLKRTCDSYDFTFQSTSSVEPLEGIIGQERAVKAMEFGLKITKHGYNIFISGYTGTGRNSYAVSLVSKLASQDEVPPDWCYVFNFKKPDQPLALRVPAGTGITFSEDVKNVVNQITVEIPKALTSEEFGRTKAVLLQELQDRQNESLENLNKKGRELGFVLKNTEKGFVSIPINNEGKPMDEQEFEKLDQEESKLIDERSRSLNLLIIDVIKKIKDMERETQEQIYKLESQVVKALTDHLFQELMEKYSWHSLIPRYFQDIKDDIINNHEDFKNSEERLSLDKLLRGERGRDPAFKYKVNVLVDNSKTIGAPVITETNPTYYNLMGKIEYETSLGVLTTDYTKIKAGALHRANGGYIIIQCGDLLRNIYSWNGLKRALKNENLVIENLNEQMGVIPASSLKPEPIPLNTKVILIGSAYEYQILYHYDEDFRKLFKIKADFDIEMERNEAYTYKLAQFISDHCTKESLRDFDRAAVASIVDYSSRLAEDQEKLSARFNEIVEIIYEADTWAEIDGSLIVKKEHVKKAIKEKIYRSNKSEIKLQEMIKNGTIIIDTKDRIVGQVNGLAILNAGDYSFGKPSRITVNTYTGRRGIINIEREAKMSGSIHDKGILILSGYMGEKFGSKCPLSFSASICFEQLYSGVEGDSASSAELYGLLSSLSGVPIKQGIAVTGSVNQKGQIQPIGGVNQKIEGFFQVCKAQGLTGEQGVMIPQQNITNLMLDEEIIEAVKEDKFHIYAVTNVEEGIEILADMPASTIFSLVQRRMNDFHQLAKKDEENEEDKLVDKST